MAVRVHSVPCRFQRPGAGLLFAGKMAQKQRTGHQSSCHITTSTSKFITSTIPRFLTDPSYEVWPGEHLVWRGDNGERRPAVVQKFDPRQRIADLLFTDKQEIQTVSVLELDTGGHGRPEYGVGIGQIVLTCDDNHTPLPEVPPIGAIEPAFTSMYWRSVLMERGSHLKADPAMDPVAAVRTTRPSGDISSVDWWGHVSDLHLDGTIGIRLANGTQTRLSLRRLQLLNTPGEMYDDDGEAPDNMFDMGMDHEGDSASTTSWETLPKSDRAIQETIDFMESGQSWDDAYPVPLDSDGDTAMEMMDEWAVNRLVTETRWPRQAVDTTSTPMPRAASRLAAESPSPVAGPSTLQDDERWVHFEMLEEAPPDHKFIGEVSRMGGKAFQTRINKEHRALMNSLPENILVRTYENRLDLMRVLIIGPEGTP